MVDSQGPVQQTYYTPAATTYNPKEIRVYDHRGRPVDHRSLPRLLKDLVPVLVSADGRGVDPRYLDRAKKGTLILVIPRIRPANTRPSELPKIVRY
jgi:hypothetical protein